MCTANSSSHRMFRYLTKILPIPWNAPFSLSDAQRKAVRGLFLPGLMMLGSALLLLVSKQVDAPWSTFRGPPESIMFNHMCLGIVLCYLALPRRRLEMWWVVAFGIAGEYVHWINHDASWDFWTRVECIGYAVGVVCLFAIAWRLCSSRGDEQLWSKGMLLLSLIMFFFANVSWWLHLLVIKHTPTLYDAYSYTVDGAFGFQPAAEAVKMVNHSTVLRFLVPFTYDDLPLFMIIAVLITLKWPEKCYGNLMLHFVAIGLAAYVCYWLFPMKGIDLFVGEGYPHVLPDEVPLMPYADDSGAFRNCYPSLHMGWMLAIYFAVRSVDPWLKYLCVSLVGLMVISTLDVGHYAVDVVAAVPYVIAFFGVVNRPTRSNRRARIWTAVGGFLLFALFSISLITKAAYLAEHPSALFALLMWTVGGALLLERWLAQTTFVSEDELVSSEAPEVSHAEPVMA